jgi:hypothetical protein
MVVALHRRDIRPNKMLFCFRYVIRIEHAAALITRT